MVIPGKIPKIIAPVVSSAEAAAVIEAGAGGLYCGVMDEEWGRRYTHVASPNRRETAAASIKNWEELSRVTAVAAENGVPVSLALNALYSEQQHGYVLDSADKALSCGVRALIVADIAVFRALKERHPDVSLHVSVGGTVFNSEAAGFFGELGAASITLPRGLSTKEIRGLVRNNPGMDFEVFVLNNACRNVDGFCTFMHGVGELEDPTGPRLYYRELGCMFNYDVEPEAALSGGTPPHEMTRAVASFFRFSSSFNACAGCALKDLSDAGLRGFKIAGRGFATDLKVKGVTFLGDVLSFLGSGAGVSDKELSEYSRKRYWEIFGVRCNESCYYV